MTMAPVCLDGAEGAGIGAENARIRPSAGGWDATATKADDDSPFTPNCH